MNIATIFGSQCGALLRFVFFVPVSLRPGVFAIIVSLTICFVMTLVGIRSTSQH